MHAAPTTEVLNCCEEAFLFNLAREDIWLYTTTSSGLPGDSITTTITSAAPTPHFSHDAAQHRRVAAVEWSTLQVLLRHATRSCAAFRNAHEVDNYVVTTLLDTKPLTASAVVAARERFVGKRVMARDLVRMVCRAGPLQPSPLTALKAVFDALLTIDKAMATMVVEERTARQAILAAETATWRVVVVTAERMGQRRRYARVLQQQQAAQQFVMDAYAASVIDVQGRAATPVDAAVFLNGSQPTKRTVASNDDARLTYLESAVGQPLRESHATVHLLQESLHATRAALQSPSWCRDPLQRSIEDYANRLDSRCALVEAKVTATRDAVDRLCRMRAGRLLRMRWASKTSPTAVLPRCEGIAGGTSCSCPSPSTAVAQKTQCFTTFQPLLDMVSGEGEDAEEAAAFLFTSVAGLTHRLRLRDDDDTGHARKQGGAALAGARHADKGRCATIDFPVFDYFAEYCDVYPSSVDVDARWSLFAAYAVPMKHRGDTVGVRGSLRDAPWFDGYGLSADGFCQFVNDLACCAEGPSSTSSSGRKVSAFIQQLLLPRWLTAPVLNHEHTAAA
jgi:hypothetical protein